MVVFAHFSCCLGDYLTPALIVVLFMISIKLFNWFVDKQKHTDSGCSLILSTIMDTKLLETSLEESSSWVRAGVHNGRLIWTLRKGTPNKSFRMNVIATQSLVWNNLEDIVEMLTDIQYYKLWNPYVFDKIISVETVEDNKCISERIHTPSMDRLHFKSNWESAPTSEFIDRIWLKNTTTKVQEDTKVSQIWYLEYHGSKQDWTLYHIQHLNKSNDSSVRPSLLTLATTRSGQAPYLLICLENYLQNQLVRRIQSKEPPDLMQQGINQATAAHDTEEDNCEIHFSVSNDNFDCTKDSDDEAAGSVMCATSASLDTQSAVPPNVADATQQVCGVKRSIYESQSLQADAESCHGGFTTLVDQISEESSDDTDDDTQLLFLEHLSNKSSRRFSFDALHDKLVKSMMPKSFSAHSIKNESTKQCEGVPKNCSQTDQSDIDEETETTTDGADTSNEVAADAMNLLKEDHCQDGASDDVITNEEVQGAEMGADDLDTSSSSGAEAGSNSVSEDSYDNIDASEAQSISEENLMVLGRSSSLGGLASSGGEVVMVNKRSGSYMDIKAVPKNIRGAYWKKMSVPLVVVKQLFSMTRKSEQDRKDYVLTDRFCFADSTGKLNFHTEKATQLLENVAKELLKQKDVFRMFKLQEKENGEWRFYGTENGFRILERRKPAISGHSEQISFMVNGLIPSPPVHVFQVLRQPLTQLEYDSTLKKMDVLAEQDGIKIYYLTSEIAARGRRHIQDFYVAQKEKIEAMKYVVSQHSVDWIPGAEKCIGVATSKLLPSGWILEPFVNKSAGNQLHTKITRLIEIHGLLGSQGQLAYILEDLVYQQALNVISLSEYMKEWNN